MSSSMLDSPAVFLARLRVVGIPETSITKFLAGSVNTLAKLAFASSSQPGSDETAFLAMLVANLSLQAIADITDGELACWRRIWYESHTVMVSEMRSRVERTEDSAPRRVPVPERAAKLAAQKLRLNGVAITGQLLPSYCLIDYVIAMREEEILKYVDPAKCTAREDELLGVKREQFVKPNAAGVLVLKESDDSGYADLTSEHRVRQALQRRSLALDQAELLPYRVSEDFHDFLYGLIAMQPPPNFRGIDVVQILNADRAIWARMSESTSEGISMRADGTYPIQTALAIARAHPMVACMLQPLPKSGGGTSSGSKGQGKSDKRVSPYEAKGPKASKGGRGSKGKGKESRSKGNGKGKNSNRGSDRMPYGLIGGKNRTPEGQKICFDFNLPGGCSREVSVGKCSNGAHVCCGCFSTIHNFQACA